MHASDVFYLIICYVTSGLPLFDKQPDCQPIAYPYCRISAVHSRPTPFMDFDISVYRL